MTRTQSKLLQIEMAAIQRELSAKKSGSKFRPNSAGSHRRPQGLTSEEWAILVDLKSQSDAIEAMFGGQRKRA